MSNDTDAVVSEMKGYFTTALNQKRKKKEKETSERNWWYRFEKEKKDKKHKLSKV